MRNLRSTFDSLFEKEMYDEMIERKVRKWSQKAFLAALFIFLYRNEPMMAGPFR
jgi:hypothetical protein